MNSYNVEHGDIGEEIVTEYLEGKGFQVTGPWKAGRICPSGPHDFDLRAEREGRYLLGDVKSKARRKYKPDTGIDERFFELYLNVLLEHKSKQGFSGFHLFFVDESIGQLYYLNLLTLAERGLGQLKKDGLIYTEKYPSATIRYFDLSLTKVLKRLSPEEVQRLREVATRSYSY